MKKWTKSETDLFIKLYPHIGKTGCVKLFKRAEGSIRQKASRLGLISLKRLQR